MDFWHDVLEKIRPSISKPAFDTWFSGTRAEIEDDVITVIANNEFAADWLEGHYKTLIFETVRELNQFHNYINKPYHYNI